MKRCKEKAREIFSFSVLDLAGDRVKDRLLFPLSMLFIFGFVVFTIITSYMSVRFPVTPLVVRNGPPTTESRGGGLVPEHAQLHLFLFPRMPSPPS